MVRFVLHFIIEIIWWTGLAPWEIEFPLPGGLMSTFLHQAQDQLDSEARSPREERPRHHPRRPQLSALNLAP